MATTVPLNEALKLVRSFVDYKGENKIAAIKALRAFADEKNIIINLAEAKWFVENV